MPTPTVLDEFLVDFRFRTDTGALRGVQRNVDRTMLGITTAALAAGAAVSAGVAASVRESIRWESSFTGVRKTVNATEPSSRPWSNSFCG